LPIERLVPPAPQQSRLVAALGKLCDQRGWERLVCGPLFEPVAEQFPDRLRSTVGGVRHLLQRLLAYVGLAHLDVRLELFDSQDPHEEIMDDGSLRRLPDHTAAWFAGITEGVCSFGLDVRQAADPEQLVGVLVHEVAHAYRYEHGLVLMDRDLEELATDLTTIYLGFGLFTVNNTYRYRSMGDTEGYAVYHGWSERSAGYLAPEEMSFLLAVQVACRGCPVRERRTIAGYLEVNQRAMFEAALAGLDVEALRVELGIPERADWPELVSADVLAEEVAIDLSPHEDDAIPLEPALLEVVADESHDPGEVVPISHRNGLAGALLGGMGMLVFGFATSVTDPAEYWLMAVAVIAAGYLCGHAYETWTCSNPSCRAHIRRGAQTCPSCGGRIVERRSEVDEDASDEDDVYEDVFEDDEEP